MVGRTGLTGVGLSMEGEVGEVVGTGRVDGVAVVVEAEPCRVLSSSASSSSR